MSFFVIYLIAVFGKACHVAVIHEDEFSGVSKHGGNIAGSEHLTFADTYDKGAVLSGYYYLVRFFFADDSETV